MTYLINWLSYTENYPPKKSNAIRNGDLTGRKSQADIAAVQMREAFTYFPVQ